MSANQTDIFCCLGINHLTASVAVRERFAVPKRELPAAAARVAALPGVGQCVVLSTCNRTEVYYTAAEPELAAREILHYFLGEQVDLLKAFYHYRGAEALEHLALVAAGLESMVIGETEIFGQVKDAYRAAQEAGTLGGRLHRIFQSVFTIGKKVRSSTAVTSGPTSVGAAAVQQAHDLLDRLHKPNVLVVGAGEVARTTAQSLRSRGAESIFVANRSYDRAVELAEQVGGRVIRFAEWQPYLEKIHIVIVSTAAPVYVVTPDVLQKVLPERKGEPLMIIDLSVPRNVDPACGALPGVTLHDIDTLQAQTEQTRAQRRAAVQEGRRLITAWKAEHEEALLGERIPRREET